jgi:seryl-tRNA synthetase
MVATAGVSGLKPSSQDRRSKRFSPDSRTREISINRSDLRALHKPLQNQVRELISRTDTRSEIFQKASNELFDKISNLTGVQSEDTAQVLRSIANLNDKKVINQVAEAMKNFYKITGLAKDISIEELVDGINMLNDPTVFKKAKRVADFAARQFMGNDLVKKPESAIVAKNSPSARKNESSPVLAA